MKNEIVKLGLILCIISLIASGLLALANDVTAPIIAEQQIAADDAARKQIIPDAELFEKVEGDFGPGVVEVYKAMKGSEEIAYIVKTLSKGYAGDIEIISGINLDGTIAGATLCMARPETCLKIWTTQAFFTGTYAHPHRQYLH